VAPQWCQDKPAVRDAIASEMEKRDTWQGAAVDVADR